MGANEHNTNSVEASETMSTNSASSPVPSYTSHNHSNDMTTSNDINVETKRRHKSSSDDSKVGSQSTSSTVSKPLQAASAQAVITPTAVSSSSSMAASQQVLYLDFFSFLCNSDFWLWISASTAIVITTDELHLLSSTSSSLGGNVPCDQPANQSSHQAYNGRPQL